MIDLHSIFAADHGFDAVPAGAIIHMHNPAAAKFCGKTFVIRDIILVRQQHRAHPAQALDLLHELGSKAR
jgi:hypothetical protein